VGLRGFLGGVLDSGLWGRAVEIATRAFREAFSAAIREETRNTR